MTDLIQDTIDDSEEILLRIKKELLNANHEILIAMAWFTNQEIFDILSDKLNENIKISILLSEQPDNNKLEFDSLINRGAQLIKIKNIGWGMMHQKFCIIDRKVAISGSYNWSNNAKNNHEHVIVTNYTKTIDELVHTFYKIQNRAKNINVDVNSNSIDREELDVIKPIGNKIEEFDFHDHSLKEFREVLNYIIATEVGSFDKDFLKNKAYERALENNGDHQILHQAMDSLYSNFINEISVIENKKIRLKGKIDEQLKVSSGNLYSKTENEINSLKKNLEIDSINFENLIKEKEKLFDQKINKIDSIKNIKIPSIEEKLNSFRRNISELKLDFVKPPINWPMSILLSSLALVLFLYILIFYSSVAYIFIFSKEDTLAQLALGLNIETAEVFNAHAISKIWDKGIGGIMFLFLFVVIPISLGLLELITEQNNKNTSNNRHTFWNTKYLGVLLIAIVDGFMAYKVSKNINEVDYLTNKTDVRLEPIDVFLTESFWLVFILGTLGVYLFGIITKNLFEKFNNRNPTFHQEKTKYLIKNIEDNIAEKVEELNLLKEESAFTQSEAINLEKEIEALKQQKQNLPLKVNADINILNQKSISFNEKIENLAQIFRSQIDNDRLPLSKTEMENRVNIFMEGWSKFLHDKYAVGIAESKTADAINQCENWLNSLSIQTNVNLQLN